jgi:hypothetical protein
MDFLMCPVIGSPFGGIDAAPSIDAETGMESFGPELVIGPDFDANSVADSDADSDQAPELGDDSYGLTEAELFAMLALEPGPATITQLCAIVPRGLSESGRQLLVEAWRRQEAWVAAKSQEAVIAAAEPISGGGDDESWLREEVGLALRLSPGATEKRIDVARALAGPYSGTMEALEWGDISYRHAESIVEICYQLDAETVAHIEAIVLPKAADQTVAEFRRSVRRALMRVAPDLVAAGHKSAMQFRDLVLYPEADGMATLSARMAAADAQTVWLALDTLAYLQQQETRDGELPGGLIDTTSIGARRTDALLALANQVLADPKLPKVHGRPVRVELVIDIATAVGLAENACELVGYGPIPASVGRELAADSDWQRFLVDPASGHLLDIGRRTYRPSQRLSDFIIARDRRCRFPSCTRRATRCDIDHAVPHGAGGETSRKNCGCLCRRHHRLKTFGGWTLESFDDGSCRWTSPGGQKFFVEAPRYLDTCEPVLLVEPPRVAVPVE